MARRRRNLRKKNWGQTRPRRPARNTRKKPLKERFFTVTIWALTLINIVLIGSLVSDFFGSTHEKDLSLTPANLKPEPQPETAVITVEVLNACGVKGLARDFTEYLRKENFDVVNVGNYEGGFDLEQTYVLDRVSLNKNHAQRVAEALGVNEKQVQPQLEKSRHLMVTVLVGKDYKRLRAYREIRRVSQR